ncbi:phage terminase small subunit P27 family [Bradyrhizobium sp.]
MNGHDKETGDLIALDMRSFMLLCPAELGPIARIEWERVVIELAPFRLLKSLDVAMVALYCNAYAGWLEAAAAIKEYGAVIKTPNGYPVQSPYVTIANQHGAVLLRCSDELGLSPASRIKNLGERKSTVWEDWEGRSCEGANVEK